MSITTYYGTSRCSCDGHAEVDAEDADEDQRRVIRSQIWKKKGDPHSDWWQMAVPALAGTYSTGWYVADGMQIACFRHHRHSDRPEILEVSYAQTSMTIGSNGEPNY